MPVVGKQNSLVVQCALPIEARSVAARLKRARRGSLGLFEAWEGMMGGVPVLVVVSGIGTSEASIAAAEMIRLFEPCALVDYGTAGALSESWAIGQCALVDVAFAYQPPQLLPPPEPEPARPAAPEAASDRVWLKFARDALDIKVVKVGCSGAPVMDPHLAQYLSAVYGFDWVDCESYSVLDVAARKAVPALGLRTVTDYCGRDAEEQFKSNARRALGGAARTLETLVSALHEAGMLVLAQG